MNAQSGWIRWLGLAGDLAPLFVAVGCTTIEVQEKYGPGWDVAGLGPTFDWAAPPAKPEDNARAKRPDVDKLIQETVEKAIEGRGYRKQAGGTPDFWIDYRLAREMKADPYVAIGNDRYEQRYLVVDVVNPKTKQIAWRASASKRLDPEQSIDQMKKNLSDAVRMIVDKLPRRKG
jgi:hypothetical protein